jgi:hypothetical protein
MIAAVFAVVVLVLGVPEQPGNEGFVAALRIQLAGRGEVTAGPVLDGRTLPARVEEARAAARAQGAGLAVWVERARVEGGGEEVLLVVVGEAEGRAVVQVFRVPGGPPADTERALALKVGSVLDALITTGAKHALVERPPPLELPRPRVAWAPWLAAGLAGSSSPGERDLTGALVLRGGAYKEAWALGAELRLGLGDTWANAAGDVSTRELDTTAVVALGELPGGLTVVAGAGARLVRGAGTSYGGTEGTAWVALPLARLALEKSWDVGMLALTSGLDVSVATVRQRFSINDFEVADLGRFRAGLTLTLTWRGR